MTKQLRDREKLIYLWQPQLLDKLFLIPQSLPLSLIGSLALALTMTYVPIIASICFSKLELHTQVKAIQPFFIQLAGHQELQGTSSNTTTFRDGAGRLVEGV